MAIHTAKTTTTEAKILQDQQKFTNKNGSFVIVVCFDFRFRMKC